MDFASVPDKYLALTGECGMEQETEVLYDKINGIGTHEVVLENSVHNTELELLPQRLIKVAAMKNEKNSELPSGFQEFFMCSGIMNRLNQTALLPRLN
jgi:galactose-1-phosphate uridylyltransferase